MGLGEMRKGLAIPRLAPEMGALPRHGIVALCRIVVVFSRILIDGTVGVLELKGRIDCDQFVNIPGEE